MYPRLASGASHGCLVCNQDMAEFRTGDCYGVAATNGAPGIKLVGVFTRIVICLAGYF